MEHNKKKQIDNDIHDIFLFISDEETTWEDFYTIEKRMNNVIEFLNSKEKEPKNQFAFSPTKFKENKIKDIEKEIIKTISSFDKNNNDIRKLEYIFDLDNLFLKNKKTLDIIIEKIPELFEKAITKIKDNNLTNSYGTKKHMTFSHFLPNQDILLNYLIHNKPDKILYFIHPQTNLNTIDAKGEQYSLLSYILNENIEIFNYIMKESNFSPNCCHVSRIDKTNKPIKETNLLTKALKRNSYRQIEAVLNSGFSMDYTEWEKDPYDYIFYGIWNKKCQLLKDNNIKPSKEFLFKKIENAEIDNKAILKNISLDIQDLLNIFSKDISKPFETLSQIIQFNPDILKENVSNNKILIKQIFKKEEMSTNEKEEAFFYCIENGLDIKEMTKVDLEKDKKPLLLDSVDFSDKAFKYLLYATSSLILEEQENLKKDKKNTEHLCLNSLIEKPKQMQVLIEKGFDVNSTPREDPILISTIKRANSINIGVPNVLESFRLLLNSGVDVNMRDKQRNTALFYVQDLDMFKTLVEEGAKHDVKNRKKETPLDYIKGNISTKKTDNISDIEKYVITLELPKAEKKQKRRNAL